MRLMVLGRSSIIRTIVAQTVTKHGQEPRSISFKGTIQTLEAFQPMLAMQGELSPATWLKLDHQLLDAVVSHRVGDRPDRYKSRLGKRRPKHFGFFRKPRGKTKREMLKGVSGN